jgi:RNA polymerase sigma factor (sigma-70 family)
LPEQDTSLGGSLRGFETTQWSQVVLARDGEAAERRRAFERLLERYWKPVYAYVRLQWGYGNEDSKDLTQQFFTWLLEGNALDHVRRNRGRFRIFLRVVLRNFLTDAYRSGKALQHGGDRAIVDLEEAEEAVPAAGSPEAAMDQEWRRALVSQGLDLLRQEYRALGKEAYYRLFEAYYFGQEPEPSHEAVAARFGISPTDVNNHLADARRRFRRNVYGLVARSVTDAEGLRLEIRDLFGTEALP